ncbi:caspase domain-containing protein [Ephemerocybe angulata]|uniref:Caspase domain-containing protein n=1 Tax=Ephemerocybe angulata TaxID=980116 RepID=A0A8H6IL46_9AGAR|nr:caspase domain-containing protein [Tulosesus angulatus]
MKIISFISTTTRRIIKRPPPIVIPHSPPLLQAPVPAKANEEPEASSSKTPALPTPGTSSKKRALLIGIQNRPPNKDTPTPSKAKRLSRRVTHKFTKQPPRDPSLLLGCHKDLYGYKPEDIVVLMDGDDPDCILPTEENILKHMEELVADAQPGDRFFFHFSGHSTQEETDDPEEEDGMNELIVTYDNKCIRDDTLRATLVEPLPVGSSLVAVLDTCHSASLLDLKHIRCNRVYVPWTNKGKRRSLTQYNSVVRRQAAPMSPIITGRRRFPLFRDTNGGSINQRLNSPQSKSGSGRRVVERRRNFMESGNSGDPQTPLSAIPREKTLSMQEPWLAGLGGEHSPIERCASPEELYCEGWCQAMLDGNLKYPEVISLSAAKDGQRAWEDSNGSSMTQSLVNNLRRDPHPSLHDLLMNISHDLHGLYRDIHAKSRSYKKQARIANLARAAKGKLIRTPEPVEMDNFQNPQISSLYPLDTHAQRWAP